MESTFETLTVTVPPPFEGTRVDKVFATLFQGEKSRVVIQKAIEDRQLTIDGRTVTQLDYHVHANEQCQLRVPLSKAIALQPNPQPIDILFEDRDMIVVNKPDGQVVHPGHGVPISTTLVEALLSRTHLSTAAGALRPGVVHRLDQGTSGIILFAKTDTAYWALTRAFAERRIQKTYHALVWGIPHVRAGTIDAPIGRSQRDRTAMCITNNGRPSETQWECAEIFSKANQALLICHPLTGRTHQIRVHLKHIGHPIVGDEKYGKPDARLFLHATELTLQHPISQKRLTFRAPLPENFHNKLNQLRAACL